MVKEVWTKDTDYGTQTAAIYSFGANNYFVDMHSALWNKYYKSYTWAKKYLERNGYKHSTTVIKLG